MIWLYWLLALLLDFWRGEPLRGHPLMIFGDWAAVLEKHLYGPDDCGPTKRRWNGVLALLVAVGLPVLLITWLTDWPLVGEILAVLLLYLTIGAHSLRDHGEAVASALEAEDLASARLRVSFMVSRETAEMNEEEVAKAAVESVLENGNDAIFGALFWFALLGAPGAVLYRLVNTLDAMWGYRNDRYRYFGWAAARLDDLLNWIPARLTALSYALMGDFAAGWRAWRRQAAAWDSPNAGPVMAAGAGALGVSLGGGARYHGEWRERPLLGEGTAARRGDIRRAWALVQRAVVLWLVVMFSLEVLGA